MLTLVLALSVHAAPFPLPTIDGKAPAVTEGQKSFRLPMRFERVRSFYAQQFGNEAGVTVAVTGTPGARVLTVSSKRLTDAWTKAVAKEGELETVVTVNAIITGGPIDVTGRGKPLVEFIISRSADVDRAVSAIGDKHVNQLH